MMLRIHKVSSKIDWKVEKKAASKFYKIFEYAIFLVKFDKFYFKSINFKWYWMIQILFKHIFELQIHILLFNIQLEIKKLSHIKKCKIWKNWKIWKIIKFIQKWLISFRIWN